LLAALAGLGVTDAEIQVSGGELPAADGSALPFAEAILAAGTSPCGTAAVHGLFERVFTTDGGASVAIASGEGHWRYEFDSGERWPGSSVYEVALTPSAFATALAPARTFAFEEEVAPLRQAGLGQGLDEASCLVLGESGYVNRPRFPDEPARHKLLDVLGDLSLAGVPARLLNVVASRSGHTLNVQAAGRLAARVRVER
jgi:UDP-3-O-acyl-N-acetylglucosamine deacetylase